MPIFRSSASTVGDPGYPERSGQEVQIVRPLTVEEADLDEVGPMFRIRFRDGVETSAFEDALLDN